MGFNNIYEEEKSKEIERVKKLVGDEILNMLNDHLNAEVALSFDFHPVNVIAEEVLLASYYATKEKLEIKH